MLSPAICGGFHVQLIPSGYATCSKGIPGESARAQRGQQGKGSSLFLPLKIPTFNKLTELSVGMKIQVRSLKAQTWISFWSTSVTCLALKLSKKIMKLLLSVFLFYMGANSVFFKWKMKLFLVKKKKKKKCLKIIGAFTWERKENKEKYLIQIIALLDSRQAWISMSSFTRDRSLYVRSTGPLKGHSDAVCASLCPFAGLSAC